MTLQTLENWVVRNIVKHRKLAIFVSSSVFYFIPRLLISNPCGYLARLKARAFVSWVALLIEKGEVQTAENLILKMVGFYQEVPFCFFYLFEITIDKKYKLGMMRDVNLRLDLSPSEPVEMFKHQINIARSYLFDDTSSELQAFECISSTSPDEDVFNALKNEYLSFYQQLDNPEVRTLFREYLTGLTHLTKDSSDLLNTEFGFLDGVKYFDPAEVVLNGNRLFTKSKFRFDVWEALITAYFLQASFGKVEQLLQEGLAYLTKRGTVKKIEAHANLYVKMGNVFYRFGMLELFRSQTSGLDFKKFYKNNPFPYLFIKSGVVEAYRSLTAPVDTIMSNFKGIRFIPGVFLRRKVLDLKNTNLVLISNVNALCNQFMQTIFFNALSNDCNAITVSCDHRLKTMFERNFKGIKFIGLNKFEKVALDIPNSQRRLINQDILASMREASIVSSIPYNYYLSSKADYERLRLQKAWLKPCSVRVKELMAWLQTIGGINVGLSIGSGYVTFHRQVYRLEHTDLSDLCTAFPNINFVNLDYSYDEKALARLERESNIRIVQPNIDLRDDLEGVLALLTCLDVSITTPNSIMDMCAASASKAMVLDLTWQMTTWEASDKCYLYSPYVEFVRPLNRNESPKRQVITQLQQKLSEL